MASLVSKQDAINFNKCVKAGITIYPKPLTNGSNKAKAKVKLLVDYGYKIIEGKETYEQNEKMTVKILELYGLIAKTL
jgi:hypothetical protein